MSLRQRCRLLQNLHGKRARELYDFAGRTWIIFSSRWVIGSVPCVDPCVVRIREPEPLSKVVVGRLLLKISLGLRHLCRRERWVWSKRWRNNIARWRRNSLHDRDFPWLHDCVRHAVKPKQPLAAVRNSLSVWSIIRASPFASTYSIRYTRSLRV